MNGESEKKSAADRLSLILSAEADVVYLSEDFYGVCQEVDSVLKSVYPYSTYDYNLSHYFYSKFPLGERKRVAEE